MTDKPELSRRDRDLVRCALEARRDADPGSRGDSPLCDDLALAAYLDGTLDAQEREEVEAALADSPVDRELWLAARDGLAAPADPAPEAAIRRAQALVEAVPGTERPAERRVGPPSRLGGWLGGLTEVFAPSLGPLRRTFGAALAALALVIASATGFELGRTGYGSLLAADQTREEMYDGFGDPADDIL